MNPDKNSFALLSNLRLCPHIQAKTIFIEFNTGVCPFYNNTQAGFSDPVRLDKIIRKVSVAGGYV